MRYVYWARVRAGRLLTVLLATLIYFLLLTVDGLRFFSDHVTNLSWVQFGFSALVALLFLAVGALVWLYARDRLVALLLFCFSLTMMMSFAVQTDALLGDPLLSLIGGLNSGLAVFLFSALLLLFPKNYLSLASQMAAESGGQRQSSRQHYYVLLLRGYLTVLALLSVTVLLQDIFRYLQLSQPSDWLRPFANGYYVLALAGILITIIVSYRQSSSLRMRQQQRIFVNGVVLAFAPLLLLTLLPTILNLPSIDPQLSTITLVLLPLALGYSILRYQILVFDMYIRRAVAWIVSIIALAVVGYLVFAFRTAFLSSNSPVYIIGTIVAMAVLGPLVWWLAHAVTDRLFFSEMAYYRRLVEKPDLLARETFDIDGATRLITTAAVNAFETQEVCLFVLNEDTGYYQLHTTLKDDDPRLSFVQQLLHRVNPAEPGDSNGNAHAPLMENANWLGAQAHVIKRIASAERPLLLSEASRSEEEMPTGLARYLVTTAPLGGFDPLLAPIRTQGRMIGVLALGERGDHGQYAGPDFEAMDLIQSRFSPVLETARLYAQASRHVAVLEALYSGIAKVGETSQEVEEITTAYTGVAAEAIEAGAEIWLYDTTDRLLQHAVHLGSGPRLVSPEVLLTPQATDWSSWFYEGGNSASWQGPSTQVPPCLPQTPYFPFAWLPLHGAQGPLGVLALTYPRPHRFAQEEKRVLSMFADQFATALANADFTVKLRAAYERQKELDRLKDQFITTASHELRTPLSAVVGYIDLLNTYNEALPPERRAEFIAKAHRGCDELTLIVGNIMDAGHVEIDAENLTLSQVPLAMSVRHILEILEGVTRREERPINLAIPDDICVVADDLRLRQVLLNLLSNALKYSPERTPIDITFDSDGEHITVRIRDRGLGVPLEDQQRLFERFVRLERDMNSPTRGAGLGLYISKQLIEAMGGRIWVESTGIAGEGSVFAFTLKSATAGTSAELPENAHIPVRVLTQYSPP